VKGRSAQRHFRTIRNNFDQPKGGGNPFASLVENLCEVTDLDVDEIPRPKADPVRIALVSMPALTEGVDFDFRDYHLRRLPRGVDPEDCKRSLVALRGNLHERWLEAYKEALSYAVDEFRAHIICVSELGLPHRNVVPLKEAQTFARKLSSDRNVLIVAGTSHDERTLYNTGYVYHPGSNGWAFHKTLSASGMGELISSPAARRVLRVKAFGLRIAMMICLDIADYATLASVIRVRDNVEMLLVPCYTEKFDKMLEVAKLASKALRGIVAMVNGHVPNAVCHIARFGKDEEPVRKKDFASGAVVSLFEVEHQAIEAERTRKHSPRDHQHVDWLFGNRDPHIRSRMATNSRRVPRARSSKRGR
jgi:hypothetical protein